MAKATGEKSREFFQEAQRFIPGGVNSPVRSFKAVHGEPLFIERGQGSKIYDVDGGEYIDYVCSWGPLILGHAHPRVVEALKRAVERGTSYGAPTALEIQLAEMIIEAVPSVEMVRMVNSGTEATMSAIRVARGYTGRDKIVKFTGCYHGHVDSLLVKAGSGATTLGIPDSPGVPAPTTSGTISAPFNDLKALERVFSELGDEIAAVIMEPVPGNMGTVLPKPGFLEGVRKLTQQHGSLLIFDEVMTGFRVAYGGAQSHFGVEPDLTCLGKVIGGGLPVGAYGGRREIMEMVAPVGPVYQAGTLSGNPLAMTAGVETLKILSEPGVFDSLVEKTTILNEGMKKSAEAAGVKVHFTQAGTMFAAFFTEEEVTDYTSAQAADTRKYAVFFKVMLENGVYMAPSQFETAFMSVAHTEQDLQKTITASYEAFKAVQGLG